MSTQNRQPAGAPAKTGGQFASASHDEATGSLAPTSAYDSAHSDYEQARDAFRTRALTEIGLLIPQEAGSVSLTYVDGKLRGHSVRDGAPYALGTGDEGDDIQKIAEDMRIRADEAGQAWVVEPGRGETSPDDYDRTLAEFEEQSERLGGEALREISRLIPEGVDHADFVIDGDGGSISFYSMTDEEGEPVSLGDYPEEIDEIIRVKDSIPVISGKEAAKLIGYEKTGTFLRVYKHDPGRRVGKFLRA